jgi:hypothetical protein
VKEERVLSLDISTKTGHCLLISGSDLFLESHGQLAPIHMPDGLYPGSFIDWAYLVYKEILEVIDSTYPDVLVIEETSSGSKSVYSQKILEYIHFLVASFIKETGIKAVYIMSEQWRRETGCKMSKAESKHNKDVRDYKKNNKTKIAYNAEGKRIGILTRKHVNIRRANEVFGHFFKEPLRKKDEDLADSCLLGLSYHLRRLKAEVKSDINTVTEEK